MTPCNRYVPGPCAACGKPEGGIMSATEWGHDHLCCSAKCGKAFATKPERAAKEAERVKAEIALYGQTLEAKRRELVRWQRLAGLRPAPVATFTATKTETRFEPEEEVTLREVIDAIRTALRRTAERGDNPLRIDVNPADYPRHARAFEVEGVPVEERPEQPPDTVRVLGLFTEYVERIRLPKESA